ncbi:MAG: C4-type zinc ribbon domain-containing protein [Deltaproteobacteria bacterium]|nr:C4-type zinc ribbon domain-containing protein [Deltaproteobacteria bacterium]
MKDILLKLVTLQDLDNKMAQWRRTIAEGPSLLAQAGEKLAGLEAALSALQTRVAENARLRRELEAEAADLTQRKATNQARQLKARNNDEYRAVLKEAESITTQLGDRETKLLVLMDEADKLEADLPGATAERGAERESYQAVAVEIEKAVADSLAQEAQAQVEREALLASIPRDALSRYQTVAKNRDGQAMAPISGGLCQVCRLSIPPQLFNELQKNDKMLACPNCARIIYWRQHPHFKAFAGPEPEPEATPAEPEKPPEGRKRKSRAKAAAKVADEQVAASGALADQAELASEPRADQAEPASEPQADQAEPASEPQADQAELTSEPLADQADQAAI